MSGDIPHPATERLKPCPFCGSDNVRASKANRESEYRLFPIARCDSCFAEVSGNNDDYSEGARTAVERWNTRATPPAPVPGKTAEEWRDISTAPRDGTRILISGGTYTFDAMSFDSDDPFNGVTIASFTGDEWCRDGYGSEYESQYWHKPTHWQPLPKPLGQS